MRNSRALSLIVLAAACAFASAVSVDEVSAAEPAGESSIARVATLDDFAWLTGYWVGEAQGVTMEECWLPPSGGLVLGLHRDVLPSGKSSFEFFRIEVGEKGIAYMASPRGASPTPFWLVSSGPSKAVFENLEHDFPRRITYWLDADDVLHARVEGPDDGKTRVEEWFWRRADLKTERAGPDHPE